MARQFYDLAPLAQVARLALLSQALYVLVFTIADLTFDFYFSRFAPKFGSLRSQIFDVNRKNEQPADAEQLHKEIVKSTIHRAEEAVNNIVRAMAAQDATAAEC